MHRRYALCKAAGSHGSHGSVKVLHVPTTSENWRKYTYGRLPLFTSLCMPTLPGCVDRLKHKKRKFCCPVLTSMHALKPTCACAMGPVGAGTGQLAGTTEACTCARHSLTLCVCRVLLGIGSCAWLCWATARGPGTFGRPLVGLALLGDSLWAWHFWATACGPGSVGHPLVGMVLLNNTCGLALCSYGLCAYGLIGAGPVLIWAQALTSQLALLNNAKVQVQREYDAFRSQATQVRGMMRSGAEGCVPEPGHTGAWNDAEGAVGCVLEAGHTGAWNDAVGCVPEPGHTGARLRTAVTCCSVLPFIFMAPSSAPRLISAWFSQAHLACASENVRAILSLLEQPNGEHSEPCPCVELAHTQAHCWGCLRQNGATDWLRRALAQFNGW